MGGLLVLLAVAATSVTFGWQPDENGGVEYLVQVSPDKLAQVRQTGEITSTIPPELRGHVSRIVIRVGNEPLPRTLSAATQRAIETERLAQADRQNVPVPRIGSDERPVEMVMKPQNNFSFPDAADRASSSVNAAADRLRGRATERINNTVNNLRENARDAAGNGLGTFRTAATDRTNQPRDDKWLEIDSNAGRRPTTDPVRSTLNPNTMARSNSTMREPEFVGPTRPTNQTQAGRYTQAEIDRMRSEEAANARLANARTTTNDSRDTGRGFGPNSNFGMIPAGMSSSRSAAEEERLRADASRNDRSDFGFARERLRLGDTNATDRNAMDRNAMDRNTMDRTSMDRGLQDPFANQRNTTIRQPAPNDRTTMDMRYDRGNGQSTFANNDNRSSPWPDRASTARTNAVDPAMGTGSNVAADRLRSRDVDARLSKADVDRLPAGAWSFDAYDNPIDKQLRVLDRHGNPVSAQRAYELTLGRNNPALAGANMMAAQAGTVAGANMMPPGYGTNFNATTPNMNFRPTNQPSTNVIGDRSNSGNRPGAISSPSDGRPPAADNDPSERDNRSLAAQPLFNGLLLMSIVANVYLIFWLKNLRHQFHDLVSSKRVVSSEAAGI